MSFSIDLRKKTFFQNFPFGEYSATQKKSLFIDIWMGCQLLNQLFNCGLWHIIIQVCAYLTWFEFCQTMELVNFDLSSLFKNIKNTQPLQQIFILNTKFTKDTVIRELNFNYLLNLNPSQLYQAYQRLYRFPKYNVFDKIKIGPFRCYSYPNLAFHPVLPLFAFWGHDNQLFIVDYDQSPVIRKKFWAPSRIYWESFYNDNTSDEASLIEINWSPSGRFLSLGFIAFIYDNPNFQNVNSPHKQLKICCHDETMCNRKYNRIFWLNTNQSRLQEIKEAKFYSCPHYQSRYIWNDDHIFTYYNHFLNRFTRVIIDVDQQILTKHVLPNPFNDFENFLHLIGHPNKPHLLILQTTCTESFHFHHRLFFYNLASQTFQFVSNIPGVIINVLIDPNSCQIFVIYRIFKNLRYFVCENINQSSCNCENHCNLAMNQSLQDSYRSTYKDKTKFLDYNDADPDDNNYAAERIRMIDLSNFEEKELIDDRYKNIFLKYF